MLRDSEECGYWVMWILGTVVTGDCWSLLLGPYEFEVIEDTRLPRATDDMFPWECRFHKTNKKSSEDGNL